MIPNLKSQSRKIRQKRDLYVYRGGETLRISPSLTGCQVKGAISKMLIVIPGLVT